MNAIFIIGAPRSGTTLLQSIICSQSSFFTLPDTFFFSVIIPLLGVEYSNPNKAVNSDDIKIIEDKFHLMNGFKINLCSKMHDNMTIRDAFECLVQEFNADNKEFWVEKTPSHAMYMLAINRFYPDAKFIHIIRDPVDSVGSMMALRPAVSDFRIRYLRVCSNLSKMWENHISAVLKYPYQDNVLHVFYEELVLYPHDNVQNICKFLGVPFEEKMLISFHEKAKNFILSEYNQHQQDNLIKGFNREAVHKWRKKLSPYTVWMIQQNVNGLAQYLGYYTSRSPKSSIKKIIYILHDKLKLIIIRLRLEQIARRFLGWVKT